MHIDQRTIFGLVILCGAVLLGLGISCKKTADASANQAKLSVTNLVYPGAPVDILYESVLITDSGKIATEATTGEPGNPYLGLGAGIHNFKATPDGIQFWIDGNISLITNLTYSLFLYDTLQNGKATSLILKDVLSVLPDTIAAVRLLNFSPDTLNFLITDNALDTFRLSTVPPIDSSSAVTTLSAFHNLKSGNYGVLAYKDSVTYAYTDSLYLSPEKSYTFFTRGKLLGTGADSLRLHPIRHN